MSDKATRALEREAQDPEARARVLVARLRAGEECEHDQALRDHRRACADYCVARPCGRARSLIESCPKCAGLSLLERVRLAAYAGDPAAAETGALQDLDLIGRAAVGDLGSWAHGLARWGQPVLARAALAAGRVAGRVARCPECGGSGLEDAYGACGHGACSCKVCPSCPACEASERALDAAAAWLECPCEEHEKLWREVTVPVRHVTWVPHARGAGAIVGVGQDEPVGTAMRVGEIVSAARLAGEQPVRAAVRRALVEWALG